MAHVLESNIISCPTQTHLLPKNMRSTWGTALYAGLTSLSVPAYRPQDGMKKNTQRETTEQT